MNPFDQLIGSLKELPTRWMNEHEAIAYLLWLLNREGTVYPTQAINLVGERCPGWGLSDAQLYKALQWLKANNLIADQLETGNKRGRPRRMLRLAGTHPQIAEVIGLWEQRVSG